MVSRRGSYRARRPNRARIAEGALTTALVSLVVVAFCAALIAVVNNP
ncbi:hypothetical protein AB0Q95_04390 [Streptomyces sp. NPDC059900]